MSRYESQTGCYTDCFEAVIAGRFAQADYVEAFYTTALFKVERLALAVLLLRPSSDLDARRLALGEAETFSAWTVEARTEQQILMCDFVSASRSWLMTRYDEATDTTILHFGTALMPPRGSQRLGPGFRALVPFHRIYARGLLQAAVRRLAGRAPGAIGFQG